MFGGIDVGGTNIKFGLIDSDGTIQFQDSIPTNAHRGKDSVITTLHSIVARLQLHCSTLQSVGIGFPSVVNPRDKCVYYPPNMPGWEVVPLQDILQQRATIPIAIDNDANVAALAESEFGAGIHDSHFLYVTLGTGVGGAVVINKQLFTGERGGAGEIGHVIINAFAEPTDYMQAHGRSFRAGVLEEYIGKTGIIEMAKSIALLHPQSQLHVYGNEIDVHNISEAAHNNDTAALLCLQQCGKLLGLGVASALALFDIRIVIVGGGISQSHDILLHTTQQTLQQRSLQTIAPEVVVRKAHFCSNAGIVGAAVLGKQHLTNL